MNLTELQGYFGVAGGTAGPEPPRDDCDPLNHQVQLTLVVRQVHRQPAGFIFNKIFVLFFPLRGPGGFWNRILFNSVGITFQHERINTYINT